jgi:hypothetical protein
MAGLLGFGLAAQAQSSIVLAQWTFDSDLNVTTTASDVSASALTRVNTNDVNGTLSGGDGVNPDGSSYVNGDAINDPNSWSSDATASQRAFGRVFDNIDDDYFAFDITLDPGASYQLTNVQFDAGFRSGGPNHIRVQYSLASDFSNPVTIGEGAGWLNTATTGLDYGPAADVAAIPGLPSLGVVQPSPAQFSWNRFENPAGNAPISGNVYFRVQAEGSTLVNGDANFYLDNITVTAVPEPSTCAALFGLMALGFVAWRRRR